MVVVQVTELEHNHTADVPQGLLAGQESLPRCKQGHKTKEISSSLFHYY